MFKKKKKIEDYEVAYLTYKDSQGHDVKFRANQGCLMRSDLEAQIDGLGFMKEKLEIFRYEEDKLWYAVSSGVLKDGRVAGFAMGANIMWLDNPRLGPRPFPRAMMTFNVQNGVTISGYIEYQIIDKSRLEDTDRRIVDRIAEKARQEREEREREREEEAMKKNKIKRRRENHLMQ